MILRVKPRDVQATSSSMNIEEMPVGSKIPFEKIISHGHRNGGERGWRWRLVEGMVRMTDEAH